MEERAIKVEVRAAVDDPMCIEGYASVFDSLSQDLGGSAKSLNRARSSVLWLSRLTSFAW